MELSKEDVLALMNTISNLTADLEAEISERYTNGKGKMLHPAYQRKWERDMMVVWQGKAILQKLGDLYQAEERNEKKEVKDSAGTTEELQ